MSSEPALLPPTGYEPAAEEILPARVTPTLLEAIAFFALAAILLTAIQGIAASLALHWHLFGKISLKKLALQPRFTIPVMAAAYGAILLASIALFRRIWRHGFFQGIHWNFSQVRRFAWLPIFGVAFGFLIQFVSNYLPMPKEMPVDAFFQNPLDAWMVALFGIFVAPVLEELAFRGFLYPALRSWMGGIVAAILSSIPFALLHGQQVGHAYAPLAMVFIVSLVLTAVREYTGSVAASAVVHAAYNSSIFIVIFYASGGFLHLERLKS